MRAAFLSSGIKDAIPCPVGGGGRRATQSASEGSHDSSSPVNSTLSARFLLTHTRIHAQPSRHKHMTPAHCDPHHPEKLVCLRRYLATPFMSLTNHVQPAIGASTTEGRAGLLLSSSLFCVHPCRLLSVPHLFHDFLVTRHVHDLPVLLREHIVQHLVLSRTSSE